jgi:hypothetical protein
MNDENTLGHDYTNCRKQPKTFLFMAAPIDKAMDMPTSQTQ